jgi:hypothetical protein
MVDENEFLKLVLEEVRENNRKLDEFRIDYDKSIAKVFTRAATLDERMGQAEDDLQSMHNITHGSDISGNPGLTTKVSLIENKLETMQEEKKEHQKTNAAVKVAKIGAVGAGVIAFIKIIADLLI